jgi:hypothetical protein
MSKACMLTERVATALVEIGETRARIDGIVAELPACSVARDELVPLEATLEQFHLLVVQEFGRWTSGEISDSALALRLDQWDELNP